MGRGASRATVHGVAESDRTEQLTHDILQVRECHKTQESHIPLCPLFLSQVPCLHCQSLQEVSGKRGGETLIPPLY